MDQCFWIRHEPDTDRLCLTCGPEVICVLIGEQRHANAELIQALLRSSKQVNPTNPQAVADALPDLVAACEEAEQIIKTARQYFPKSMRNADAFALENTCATVTAAIANAKRGE